MIHFLSPFRLDKDLGRAYNEAIGLLPLHHHVCIMDYDAMLLHHEQVQRLYDYVKLYPNDLLTCYPSRSHEKCRQKCPVELNSNDMRNHITIAKQRLQRGTQVREINGVISGFMMLFPVNIGVTFKQGIGCLGVDNDFSQRVLDAGKRILLMESIYIWHTYRLDKSKTDTSHLCL